MIKKNIYFLHPLGEEFIIGTPENSYEFSYTNEILGKYLNFKKEKKKYIYIVII